MFRLMLIALLTLTLAGAMPAAAQAQSQSSTVSGRRVTWTLIGGGIGFGGGVLLGVAKFDDAINSDRKVWTTALVSAAGGAVLGNLLSRPRRPRRPGPPPAPGAPADQGDSLTNGMLTGALAGAAVGMWYVPKANCNKDDRECPTALRLAVGIPAIAGGAALGALVDRMVGRHAVAASGRPAPTTFVAPVVGRRALGVHILRSF